MRRDACRAVWLSVRIVIVTLAVGSGCRGCGERAAPDGGAGTPARADRPARGLEFRLTKGTGADEGRDDVVRQGRGTPLPEGQAAALLARMKPLKDDGADPELALRAGSLPPPLTGRRLATVFPPPQAAPPPPAAAAAPLKVLRAAPKGDVPLAPHLSVTFSQPMVAVTSHAAVAASLPVKLTPQPKGKWRWVGTQTLLFEPDVRFPMATKYSVEIPAGTTSATGGKLGAAERWTFATPPPRLVQQIPSGGPQRLDPVLLLGFDQRIDAQAVAAKVRLSSSGDAMRLRRLDQAALLGAEQIPEAVRELVKTLPEGRWVALQAEGLLAAGADYVVSVPAGTPSAEGPLRTTEEQTFSFSTFRPLAVEGRACESYDCSPLSSIWIRFNNALDEEAFDESRIKVEPELPEQQISVSGTVISIGGRTKGRTTYRVSLPSSLRDAFGQQLGHPEQLSFHFGKGAPQLVADGGHFRVLDPEGPKRFTFRSMNHREVELRVLEVTPADWSAFKTFQREWYQSEQLPEPPGRVRRRQALRIRGDEDELVETAVDLAPFLRGGHGQLIVLIRQRPMPTDRQSRYQAQQIVAWVQATDLAVDAFSDHERMLAWVTRLKDGAPVAGAEVALSGGGPRGRTDAAGIARLALPPAGGEDRLLVARQGGDLALLPESPWPWARYSSSWQRRGPPGEQVRWYVFDDRKLYRPKEQVSVKGWVRVVDMGATAGVQLLPETARSVSYRVVDPRGNEIGKGTVPLGPTGGFDVKFGIPDRANLGSARVELAVGGVSTSGASYHHGFEVQEFRRPEFEVKAQAGEGPHLVGGAAEVEVAATYFAGGGLAGAQVDWIVTASAGSFAPPNHGDYTFVGWRPTWWGEAPQGMPTQVQRFTGRTDGKGNDRLRILLDAIDPPVPAAVQVAATVQDVNRQTWTANASLVVHPARCYVGLRTERYFVAQGQPLKVGAVVADLDGKRLAGRKIEVRFVRLESRWERGSYRTRELDEQRCEVASGAAEVSCEFRTHKGGTHLVSATVKDEQGRTSRTEMMRWVAGAAEPPRGVEQQLVRLIPDREEYQPGDTASVLVQSPLPRAEGLLTIRRGGIRREQRFQVRDGSATLKIPIAADHMPSLQLHVALAGSAPRVDAEGQPLPKLPPRPAHAAGTIALPVPPRSRQLKVEVRPQHTRLAPASATEIAVQLADARGQPVAGELALVVVDEAVLALTGYTLGDPLAAFYPVRDPGVLDAYLRAWVRLAEPWKPAEGQANRHKGEEGRMGKSAPGGARARDMAPAAAQPAKPAPAPPAAKAAALTRAAEKEESRAPAIQVRSNFGALALFAPSVRTDERGRASVRFKLPDTLTRYRVMAVAVSGATLYGLGEAAITARLPVALRPSLPRFLNLGDRVELPVVLQNQTDGPLTVRVALRGSAQLKLLAGSGREVAIPADDRVEVRFPAEVLRVGQARIQVAAAAGDFADGTELELPVWTPTSAEAFATYGTLDEGVAVQPVQLPPGVFTSYGGLELSTSSTALQALTDAVLYLVDYPFECAEQVSSRLLSIAALRDVLAAFKAPGLPPPAELAASMARDIEKLERLQDESGGFALWKRGDRTWPFVSVHVTHALVRAKAKGFAVPAELLRKALAHVQRIESYIPAEYGAASRRAIVSYALYVRALAGDVDVTRARAVLAELRAAGRDLPLEGVAWIYPVLSAGKAPELPQLRKLLDERATETASTAQFATSYGDDGYLLMYSDRRLDALLLEGLIQDQPRSDLIVKLVRGLLGHQKRGRWSSTQENAWVLLALDRYFRTYERATPSFVARAWLGRQLAAEHPFRGRTTDQREVQIPMRALAALPDGRGDLTLTKQGAGRLYYRIGMRYVPKDLRLPPASHGFTVERRYEAVDDPGDVRRDGDGTWRVKAGARVRVRLTVVAPARRYHVALVDPLPAGLEPINAELRGAQTQEVPAAAAALAASAATPSARLGGPYRWWYWWRWYEHENLRDERVEAFTSLLWEGVHEYSYVARATTPGTFVAPPPKAEEMYAPETFGRGAGERLIVQ